MAIMGRSFRYSAASFRETVFAASLLTCVVTFLVWLFSSLAGMRHPVWLAATCALIFFGFCSAAMIWRYTRRSVILAVRPDGLYDARQFSDTVPWAEIKDVSLRRAENDFTIDVTLWPDVAGRRGKSGFSIDLAPLDGGVNDIVEVLAQHTAIRPDGL